MSEIRKSLSGVTSGNQELISTERGLILTGFSCKNNHTSSTNSSFTLRHKASNGPVAFHVNLSANESRAEVNAELEVPEGLWLADVSGDIDISVFANEN